MKTDAEANIEKPIDARDSEPAPPSGEESPEVIKEREIDELRRFRVRTVPPDMRRQWMLAETPIVSTLELQDTVPPNKRPSSVPPNPDAPRPLFTTPRVSSTAPTRKLPRVVARSEHRLLRILVAMWALIAVAVLTGLALRNRPSHKESVVPSPTLSEPSEVSALETATAVRATEPKDPAPPAAAPTPAPVRAKLPQTSPNPSGKISPAKSPRPESDIKSPLFGK